jgi:hypothetical protein
MQKADTTGSGKTTTPMAHCGGKPIGTTARVTGSGSGTALMAHCGGEPNGTTGSGKDLIRRMIVKAELSISVII